MAAIFLDLGKRNPAYFMIDALLHLALALANARVYTDFNGMAQTLGTMTDLLKTQPKNVDVTIFSQMTRVHFALFLVVLMSWMRERMR